MISWILFATISTLAYIAISLFGQLSGGSSPSALTTALSVFKPLTFITMVAGNVLWGVAVFYGLQNTTYAVTAAIALGAIVSFIYSAVILGAPITSFRILGIAVILVGIYLLR